ncbi:uncharacterized protein LOC130648477 [Hydractinia symbiolongicarpus]|uniref:uncharacterized protein LOC130648477 n=1 Tax=Hydractinia symbiolongicarpus TaxID=13093 RepID=UPI00254E6B97|nr:uncharacterized protein LOC130648477 [Hydractinia symbiolongicarpus]
MIEETQKEVEDGNKTNVNLLSSLINEIRKYPCVWNMSSKTHKDKYKIAEAWRRLSAALQHPETALQKIFLKLKDNYRQCIRKREQATRSGTGHKNCSSCTSIKFFCCGFKRKTDIDDLLRESLAADLKKSKQEEGLKQMEKLDNNDSDDLFCKSLIEHFRELTKRQKKRKPE